MSDDRSLLICPENHPDRCTEITSMGQCTNYAQEGDSRCAMHNRKIGSVKRKKRIHDLYVNMFQQDIKNFSDAGSTNLRAEISILRMLLQNLLSTCNSKQDLILNMGPLTAITAKISDLAATMDRIAMNSGNLLDEDDIIQLGNEIIQTIATRVTDKKVLALLASDLAEVFSRRRNEDEEETER